MNQSRQVSGPSLELIFETIHGFQRTGAMKAALELDEAVSKLTSIRKIGP